MWLVHPETGATWDLLPQDPFKTDGGCAFLKVKGLGYNQDITQEQVEAEYYVSEIKTANKPINGVLYFNGDEHLQNFQAFVGDFRRQLRLYYSPDGEYQPYDIISSPYYKNVIIQQVDKTEKDQYGWYECSVSLATQNDVWKRDLTYFINSSAEEYDSFADFPPTGTEGALYKDLSTNLYYKWDNEKYVETDPYSIGEALVYPYTYEYVMGDRDIYTIDLPNDGREVGCIIKIKNNSETPLTELEWFVEHSYIDEYGITQYDPPQRSRWFTTDHKIENGTLPHPNNIKTDVTLRRGYELYVDSNPLTQEAKVIYNNGTSQSVVAWQEPSWDYINFVRLKHGQNRIVFYVAHPEVDITVAYQEQKELI